MEVPYDQEPFARPRYGHIVTDAGHEEQRKIKRYEFHASAQRKPRIGRERGHFLYDRDGHKEYAADVDAFATRYACLRPGSGIPRNLVAFASAHAHTCSCVERAYSHRTLRVGVSQRTDDAADEPPESPNRPQGDTKPQRGHVIS